MLKIKIKNLVDSKFDNINQFAKAIGIGYQPAEKLYNGDVSRIGLDTLESICDVLDCTPSDILVKEEKSTDNVKYNRYASAMSDQPSCVAEEHYPYGFPSGERVDVNHDSPILKNVIISSKNKPQPTDPQFNKLLTEIVTNVVNVEMDKQFSARFKKYADNLDKSTTKTPKKGGE